MPSDCVNLERSSDVQYYLPESYFRLSHVLSDDLPPTGAIRVKLDHRADAEAPFVFTRGRGIFDTDYTVVVDQRGLLQQVRAGGDGVVTAAISALAKDSAQLAVNRQVTEAFKDGEVSSLDGVEALDLSASEAADARVSSADLLDGYESQSSGTDVTTDIRTAATLGEGSAATRMVCSLEDIVGLAESSGDDKTEADGKSEDGNTGSSSQEDGAQSQIQESSTPRCVIQFEVEYYYWGEREHPDKLSSPQCSEAMAVLSSPLKDSASDETSQEGQGTPKTDTPTNEANLEAQIASLDTLIGDMQKWLGDADAEPAKEVPAVLKRLADMLDARAKAIADLKSLRDSQGEQSAKRAALAKDPDATCTIRGQARLTVRDDDERDILTAASMQPDDFGALTNNDRLFQNDLVYYRPFEPAYFKVEQCLLQDEENECKNWTVINTFSAPIARRDQLRAVPFIAASAGSNAMALHFTDGGLRAVASAEKSATGELLRLPLVIVDAILSVPRALLVGANEAVTDGD